ncbi:MAG: TonB-dependent receptor [Marinilabiliales bacterium]|nr:TonB-dependent receptor [Marinilabiliales bacterium]
MVRQPARNPACYLTSVALITLLLTEYLVRIPDRVRCIHQVCSRELLGNIPSFSAGWVVSEEEFMQNTDWVDYLKLRASIGFLGKDNTKPWLWRQRYTYQTNKGAVFGTNVTSNVGWGLKMEAAPNPNVTWDDDTKYNVGLDMKFLKNRLSTTVDAYLDRNTNMLIQRDALVPVTIGGALAAENFDAIDAYGVELSLGMERSDRQGFRLFGKTECRTERRQIPQERLAGHPRLQRRLS